MSNTKFDSCNFSSFGDVTSQNFPLKVGTRERERIASSGTVMSFSTFTKLVSGQKCHSRPSSDAGMSFSPFPELALSEFLNQFLHETKTSPALKMFLFLGI